MPVLVISKFDEDLIKNERISLETSFSHYKSMGTVLDAQEHLTLIWPQFEQVRDFMPVSCKFEKDLIKNNRGKVETLFSLLYNGRFLLPEFLSDLPQNLI